MYGPLEGVKAMVNQYPQSYPIQLDKANILIGVFTVWEYDFFTFIRGYETKLEE